MTIHIEHIAAPTDEARLLVDELEAELSGIYSKEQRHGFDINRLFKPGILFFIARVDGEPAGCGGIAFDDGSAELKRMYVRPALRGRRIAGAILARLQEEAARRGVPRLTLETGDAQTAAIRFYERSGFTRCGPFGAYLAMTPKAIERSVFFEKRLPINSEKEQ